MPRDKLRSLTYDGRRAMISLLKGVPFHCASRPPERLNQISGRERVVPRYLWIASREASTFSRTVAFDRAAVATHQAAALRVRVAAPG